MAGRLEFARAVSRRKFVPPMNAPALTSYRLFKTASAREVAVLLAVAWFVPFAVHLAPWSGVRPLGAYLLPMFWTSFMAAYFYGPKIGALTGFFAPAVNLLVTGLPAWRFLSVMSGELVVFALITAWAVCRFPRFFLLAPIVCILTVLISTAIQVVASAGFSVAALGEPLGQAVVDGFAGLTVLSAINAVLVGFYPKAK